MFLGMTFFLEYSYEIMTECWENDPSKRPDFGSLKATFRKLMEEEEQVSRKINVFIKN